MTGLYRLRKNALYEGQGGNRCPPARTRSRLSGRCASDPGPARALSLTTRSPPSPIALASRKRNRCLMSLLLQTPGSPSLSQRTPLPVAADLLKGPKKTQNHRILSNHPIGSWQPYQRGTDGGFEACERPQSSAVRFYTTLFISERFCRWLRRSPASSTTANSVCPCALSSLRDLWDPLVI